MLNFMLEKCESTGVETKRLYCLLEFFVKLKTSFALILSALCATAVAEEDLRFVPVHGKPVWQQVNAVPQNQAPAPQEGYVEVRSLASRDVIGWVPVGYRFLAFGADEGVVTLSLNGQIGYLPRAVTSRLYASTAKQPRPPAGPVTLEKLADEYDARVRTGAGISLSSQSSIVETVSKQQALLGQPGIPGDVGLPMGGNTVITDPAQMGAGAALVTGGPQALGGYVGQPGFEGK